MRGSVGVGSPIFRKSRKLFSDKSRITHVASPTATQAFKVWRERVALYHAYFTIINGACRKQKLTDHTRARTYRNSRSLRLYHRPLKFKTSMVYTLYTRHFVASIVYLCIYSYHYVRLLC